MNSRTTTTNTPTHAAPSQTAFRAAEARQDDLLLERIEQGKNNFAPYAKAGTLGTADFSEVIYLPRLSSEASPGFFEEFWTQSRPLATPKITHEPRARRPRLPDSWMGRCYAHVTNLRLSSSSSYHFSAAAATALALQQQHLRDVKLSLFSSMTTGRSLPLKTFIREEQSHNHKP